MQIGVQGSQEWSNGLISFQAADTPPGRGQVTGDIITAAEKTPKWKEVSPSFVPAAREPHSRSSWEKSPSRDASVKSWGFPW